MKVHAENKNTAQLWKSRRELVDGCWLPKSRGAFLYGAADEPRMCLWADVTGHLQNHWKCLFPFPGPFCGLPPALPVPCGARAFLLACRIWALAAQGVDLEEDKHLWLFEGHTGHLYSHWDSDFCLQNLWNPPDAHALETESDQCVSDSKAALWVTSIIERELTFPEQSSVNKQKSQQRAWTPWTAAALDGLLATRVQQLAALCCRHWAHLEWGT